MYFASSFTVEDAVSNFVPYTLLSIGAGGRVRWCWPALFQKEFLSI